jgi:hypothetical protein
MKLLIAFILVLLVAFQTEAQTQPCVSNTDGSYSCSFSMEDGSLFSYRTFLSNGVYPEGVSCDPQGILYLFQSSGIRGLLGCTVDIETGRISCGTLNQENQKAFTIVIS